MRIAYLAQSYPPMTSGAALSLRHAAERMAGQGHQVLVIAASDRNDPYHVYKDNLTILRLRSIRDPLRAGGWLLVFPRRAILRALNDFRPDVIHVYDPFQMGKIGLAYLCNTRCPTMITIHSCNS
jgi:phosphatidylinositol alpha 1,6-mannosyltransferase